MHIRFQDIATGALDIRRQYQIWYLSLTIVWLSPVTDQSAKDYHSVEKKIELTSLLFHFDRFGFYISLLQIALVHWIFCCCMISIILDLFHMYCFESWVHFIQGVTLVTVKWANNDTNFFFLKPKQLQQSKYRPNSWNGWTIIGFNNHSWKWKQKRT